MIKRWEQTSCGKQGVWLYTCADNCRRFYERRRRPPYAFAIIEDMYVPLINGSRDTRLESRWLNERETVLARATDQLCQGETESVFPGEREINLFVEGLCALECRSPFNLEIIQGTLVTKNRTLGNMVAYIKQQTAQLTPPKLFFSHAPRGSTYILTDRPVIDSNMGVYHAVLASNLAVTFFRDTGTATHRNVSAQDVKDLNKLLAWHARDWIVACDEQGVNRWATVHRSGDGEEYRASERVVYDCVRVY